LIAVSNSIRFLLGHESRELKDIDPLMTVLEWLRTREGRTGTKEGCAEGDCGACTVAVGELHDGKVAYKAFNSCIQLLPTLDGKQLITVEDLAAASVDESGLHPVQQAMVEQHGSQCGFCTPGFVMSLFTLFHRQDGEEQPGRQDINECIAGNLCRCTGYTPIVRAAEQAMEQGPDDEFKRQEKNTSKSLRKFRSEDMLQLDFAERRFFAPRQLSQLWPVLEQYPQARMFAGATDVGLWITKELRLFNTLIYLCEIEELKRLELDESGENLIIGAAVSYTDAIDTLVQHYPGLRPMLSRLGAEQVRNAGTIGGNIANGSPIGDMPPALIALGAQLQLSAADGHRVIPLEDFFIEYGKQDLNAGECVEAVILPLPKTDQIVEVYKISKRFDQDISALCGGFSIRLQDEHIIEVRICFGGMAGIPQRAKTAEQTLLGQSWDKETLERAKQALVDDYTPLSDWRASEQYRALTAQNLLQRFFIETTSDQLSQVAAGERR
jgi:xanthine dehydrogenase small subunit